MKKTNQLITFLTVMLVFGMTASAFSQDWPQWRGVNRDGKVTGFDAPKQWPAELNAKWKVIVGLGDASPVMEAGKVYTFGRIGGDEVTMCLDAATGKEIWQNKYPAVAIAGPSASAHPGPRSTPAVGDGKVVTLGIGGVLSCLDAASGKLVWRNEDYTKEVPQFFRFVAFNPQWDVYCSSWRERVRKNHCIRPENRKSEMAMCKRRSFLFIYDDYDD
jgi:outer membrane protein assembly factor BamB